MKNCLTGSGNPFDHVCERPRSRVLETAKNAVASFGRKCHFLETHYDQSFFEVLAARGQNSPLPMAQDAKLQLPKASGGPFLSITMLRDPVERVLSACPPRGQRRAGGQPRRIGLVPARRRQLGQRDSRSESGFGGCGRCPPSEAGT